ncbi:uncharacterized protein TNCV_1794611 [Trichonephila clavipes]|nr:uncharacterized protein TNCV_1794611 [Trichonephila clavipes]
MIRHINKIQLESHTAEREAGTGSLSLLVPTSPAQLLDCCDISLEQMFGDQDLVCDILTRKCQMDLDLPIMFPQTLGAERRAAHKVRRGLTKAIMTSSNVELYNGFPSGPEGNFDEDIRLGESDCEESKETDVIDYIPVNPDIYADRDGAELIPRNSNVPGRFAIRNILLQSSGATRLPKHNVNCSFL